MAGFDAAQVEFFDPEAVAGFARDQVTGMDPSALAGFDVTQIQNLDTDALHGIGDKVEGFDDFDLDVRKELVDDSALRLGGVGSFEELLAQLTGDAGSASTPEQLEELGWDKSLDEITGVDFGTFEGLDDDALAAAFAAFEAATADTTTP